MGRRKLQFDSRRNHERKQRSKRVNTSTLTVSMRLGLLPAREFLVSVPISVYTGAIMPNISPLHSSLLKLSVLPHEWKCECPSDYSGHALVTFKTGCSNSSLHCISKDSLVSWSIHAAYTYKVCGLWIFSVLQFILGIWRLYVASEGWWTSTGSIELFTTLRFAQYSFLCWHHHECSFCAGFKQHVLRKWWPDVWRFTHKCI